MSVPRGGRGATIIQRGVSLLNEEAVSNLRNVKGTDKLNGFVNKSSTALIDTVPNPKVVRSNWTYKISQENLDGRDISNEIEQLENKFANIKKKFEEKPVEESSGQSERGLFKFTDVADKLTRFIEFYCEFIRQ